MAVQVHYVVPLVADVEVETGEVLSVHISDEQIQGPLRVTDDAGQEVGPALGRRAIVVAEGAPWPGWTTGW